MTKREITGRVHAAAGFLALDLIASFFISSAVSELFGLLDWIVFVKRTVFVCMWAMVLLIPAGRPHGRAIGRQILGLAGGRQT